MASNRGSIRWVGINHAQYRIGYIHFERCLLSSFRLPSYREAIHWACVNEDCE